MATPQSPRLFPGVRLSTETPSIPFNAPRSISQWPNLALENRSLQEKLKKQEELLNLLIHDLKNPLTAIQMTVELLRQHPVGLDSEKRRAMIERVDLLAGQMYEMLFEMINSQKETGNYQLALNPQIGELRTVINVALEQIWPIAEKKGIQIQVNLDFESTMAVWVDQLSVRLIVVNLLSNAIKYSPAGQIVTLASRLVDNNIEITVSDHGVGLTPSDIDVIFNKFAKVSSSPTGGERKTGLGLHNVKTLVSSMNGEIRVESDGPDKGASFIVCIPINH